MYWMIAQAALAAAQGEAGRKAEGAGQFLAESQARARNISRGSANIEKAAKGSLTRFMQGENNKRILRGAGNSYNAAQEELARTGEANTAGRIERQIANAEASGALAANAAFAGALGGSTDVLALTQRLQQARREAAIKKRAGQVSYEQMKQITGIMSQGIEQLDITQFNDGIDYSVDTSNRLTSGSTMLGDILGSQGFKSFMQTTGTRSDASTARQYGTYGGSEQTRILREQDSWFNNSSSFKI